MGMWGVPVGVWGVVDIEWARRGCNGGVSSFLSSSIQLMLSKNGCSLILEQLPSCFIGSFGRSYRNGHINANDIISAIDNIFVIRYNAFLHFLTLLHLLLLTFSIKSIKLPLILPGKLILFQTIDQYR